MTLQGVVWDMDGVLVDTGVFHYQAWIATFKDYAIPFSWELFRNTFGMNNTGVLTTVLGRVPDPEYLEEIANRKEAAFREIVRGKITAMPGVITWLSQLQVWGFRQAVASSAPMANIEVILEETGLKRYFNTWQTGGNLPGKPSPALFLKAAEVIGVRPVNCVVMEDAVVGVQAAKSAGMRCIAVLTTNPAEALSQADVITPHLDCLPVEIVRKLLAGELRIQNQR
jgi:beta-phosphoglucomutase